ncbi:MAG: hypothetical protein NZM28_09380, partial [Fimbriimonadales bacterium]|nr:hypothetical protein [Fimbriimonadales bacterium]
PEPRRSLSMHDAEIAAKLVNGSKFRTLDEARQAGYRLVKARDADQYYLAQDSELQPLLVRLGDIAEVRRGFTTGANEFFYLEPVDCRVADLLRSTDSPVRASGLDRTVQATTVRVKNGANWQGEIEADWLRPVIKSPRELKTLRVRPEDLRYLVFMPPDAIRDQLSLLAASGELKKRYPKAWAYIQWGEKQGYHKRPTCASRQRWWDLGERQPAKVNPNYLLDDRMRFYYAEKGVYVSDNFQELHGVDKLVAALASVPMTQVFCELGGRAPFGGGLLKVQTYEVESLPILNPAALTASQRERLLAAFEQLAEREVKSIFEELGLPKPNRDYSNIRPEDVSLEKVLPDRRALDRVVFEVLGLSEAEQLEVYRAVVELVRSRLVKAQSVG